MERIENNAPSNEQLQSLITSIQIYKADTKRLWIKENGSLKPIKLQEIDWIEAMDDYACLHVGKANHLVNQIMRELEAKLDDKMFMRIHRSTIVNLDNIQQLRPIGDGSYQVILQDGTKLSLSRGQAKKLKGLVI
ncbi:MAG: LytTR family DNA-binding domain-containing protein [Nitrospinaceae bacterium]